MKRKLVFVSLALIILAAPLAACAKPAPAPAAIPAPAAPAPAPAPVPAPAPAPAPQEAKTLSAAKFFRENVIRAELFGGAGGSSDYAARTLAAYWPEVVGTQLNVIPKHSRGGRMKVLNDIFNAKPDGLTWGGGMGWGWGIYGPKVVELLPEAKYEIEKFTWIGGLQKEGIVWVVPPDSDVKTLADLLDKEDLLFSGGAPAFGGTLAGAAFIDWFGIDARIAPGIDIPDKRLGLHRGEFDFSAETSGNALLWEEQGQVRRIAIVSDKPEAFAPGIPPMTEQVDLTAEQIGMLRTIVAASTSMRVWFAPPGIPETRVEWMRNSWQKLADHDPFQKMWKRRWPDWSQPFYGEEMQSWVEERMAQPPDLLQETLAIAEKYIRN